MSRNSSLRGSAIESRLAAESGVRQMAKMTAGKDSAGESPDLVCGVVMPISPIDGYSQGHWQDVLSILEEAIKAAGFEPRIVSSADDVGIIQARIVQNLYYDPIVVCDVSGKNPN